MSIGTGFSIKWSCERCDHVGNYGSDDPIRINKGRCKGLLLCTPCADAEYEVWLEREIAQYEEERVIA